VKVFQDEDQRILSAPPSLRMLRRSPRTIRFARGPKRFFSPQCLSLFGLSPARKTESNQRWAHVSPASGPKKPSSAAENQRAQRFEDRVVRFLSPEALDTLDPLLAEDSDGRVACCWNTSTSAVLPMPASSGDKKWLVAGPAERWREQTSSFSKGRSSDPRFPFEPEPLGKRPHSRRPLTGAIKLVSSSGKRSQYMTAFSGSSPRALRIPRMYCF